MRLNSRSLIKLLLDGDRVNSPVWTLPLKRLQFFFFFHDSPCYDLALSVSAVIAVLILEAALALFDLHARVVKLHEVAVLHRARNELARIAVNRPVPRAASFTNLGQCALNSFRISLLCHMSPISF